MTDTLKALGLGLLLGLLGCSRGDTRVCDEAPVGSCPAGETEAVTRLFALKHQDDCADAVEHSFCGRNAEALRSCMNTASASVVCASSQASIEEIRTLLQACREAVDEVVACFPDSSSSRDDDD